MGRMWMRDAYTRSIGVILLLAMTSVVISCSSKHSDLERIYGVDSLDESVAPKSVDIGLKEMGKSGFDYFREGSSVYLYSDRIGIEISRFSRKRLLIHSSAVDACVMTCFGDQDKYLGLVIGEANYFIQISYYDNLARWCFNNRINAISSLQKRSWLYSDNGHINNYDIGKSIEMDFDNYKYYLYRSCKGE